MVFCATFVVSYRLMFLQEIPLVKVGYGGKF